MAETEAKTTAQTSWRKVLMGTLFAIVLFLLYMDNHHWYSPLSYSHIGPWTDCRESKAGDTTHFTCKQGEISIEELKQ